MRPKPGRSAPSSRAISTSVRYGARAPARPDLNADFPLRGAIACACCERPLTASWSRSKTGERHPYYMCFNRACAERGKSIRRDKLEGDFAALLGELTPAPTLFELVRALVKHGWDQRLAQAHAFAKTFARDIQTLEKQIDGLLERIVEATNPTVITAYENKIAKLEREKLVLEEKRLTSGNPRGRFEDMFELAMRFLANPSKLWVSGSHAHRRLVLKLTFADRLSYCRKLGFRTPEMTLPFKALVSFHEGQSAMAVGAGLVGLFSAGVAFGILAVLFETIRSPLIRLIVALVFAAPAAVAGYALVYGITKEAVPSEIWRQIFCIVGGGFVGLSALARLAAGVGQPAR